MSSFFVSKGCSSQESQEQQGTSLTCLRPKDTCVRPPSDSIQDDSSIVAKIYERDTILKEVKKQQKELQEHVGTAIAHSLAAMNYEFKQNYQRKNKDDAAVFQAYEESRESRKSNKVKALESFHAAAVSSRKSNTGHLAGVIVDMKWNDRKREILSELKHKIYTSLGINSKSQTTLSRNARSLCNYLATKQTVHILLQTEKVEIPQHADFPPCVEKFAELVQRPNEAGDADKCVEFIKDLVHNAGKGTGSRWSEATKSLFALILDYGGPSLAAQVRMSIGGPGANAVYQTARLGYMIPSQLQSSSFAKAKDFFDSAGVKGPYIFAVDATPVVPTLRVRGNSVYGLAKEGEVNVRTAEDIINIVSDESLTKANQVNALILSPLQQSEPFYIIALRPVLKGENYETVNEWYSTAKRFGAENGMRVVGLGADGDSKVRKFYLQSYLTNGVNTNRPGLEYDGFDFSATLEDFGDLRVPSIMFPDWRHLIKKWRNQILNTRKVLILGKRYVLCEHLMQIYTKYKLKSGLWKSDVYVKDKQNVDAAVRILSPSVRKCLADWSDDRTKATQVYLAIANSLYRAYTDETVQPRERAKLAWTAVIFLRLWKQWLNVEGHDNSKHFITDQTFTDTILASHSVILSMMVFHKYYPDVPYCPWFFGSDICEKLFSYLRCFCRGKNNFSFLDMLDIAGRVQKLQELKKKKARTSKSTSWPTDLQAEIMLGMKEAEKEVVKTLKELAMIDSLVKANVLFKHQHSGDITILNGGTAAYITNENAPDELDVLSMEELVDLENGILLEHIDASRSSTTQTLTEIIAENLCSRDDTANELEDEDAPENCEHFKIGKCKFQDPLYRPPRVFHWIGCEYPGCLKWWHESCMGVTFKSTQERERYKFVCPNHDSDDLFTDKVTVTAEDGGVLERDNIANPPFEETHNRLLSNENYVEYDGQVFHIAHFLSLQEGKVYKPNSGRIARWMTTSRANFYDSIEKQTETLHSDTLSLESYVAIFRPSTGLVIGKVVRMLRGFRTSSLFPLLIIDRKESKKQQGFTELCVLTLDEIRTVEGDDTKLSRNYRESKKYIWCNYKECISPITVTINDERTITLSEKDHENLSKLLPQMREIEKKRQIEEKKEKESRLQQKKAGDPEDMTVAILREILTESGVPFKTSDKKQVLINKVREQRNKRQNRTESTEIDVCLQATITQEFTEQQTLSEEDRLGNDLADGSEKLLNSVLRTECRFQVIYFDSRRHRLLKILIIILFFLATSVDVNMFKFIEGFFACVKLLSDLLCAEIAEFFLEIAILLTTLLLILIAFLANMAVSFIARYLDLIILSNEFRFQGRVFCS
ncbi:hypothetical protein ACROYT_G014677 [Oculina patagonica]